MGSIGAESSKTVSFLKGYLNRFNISDILMILMTSKTKNTSLVLRIKK